MSHVRYAHPENGYPCERELARRFLKLGKTYTVTHTEVNPWSTEFSLLECSGLNFNSVLFDEVSPNPLYGITDWDGFGFWNWKLAIDPPSPHAEDKARCTS